MSGFNNGNSIVQFVFRSATHYGTRLCNNIVHVAYKIGVNVHEICQSNNDINWKKIVVNQWKNDVNENDRRISMQVKELIEIRDGIEPWVLDNTELNDVINLLVTE